VGFSSIVVSDVSIDATIWDPDGSSPVKKLFCHLCVVKTPTEPNLSDPINAAGFNSPQSHNTFNKSVPIILGE
jgi:hypothetical protein